MSSFSVTRGLTGGQSRWGWLPLSLALNLVLIGLVFAWVLTMPTPRQPLLTWQRELIPSLSSSDAAIVLATTERIADAQTMGDTSVHEQFGKIRAVLAVEPVDKSALATAFDAVGVARNNQQISIDHSFLDELASVSPDGRTKILKAMEKVAQHARPPAGH